MATGEIVTVEQKLFYISLGFVLALLVTRKKPRREARKPDITLIDKRLA